jgi:hypothetical protein
MFISKLDKVIFHCAPSLTAARRKAASKPGARAIKQIS